MLRLARGLDRHALEPLALVIVALALGVAAQTISMASRSYATASESERVQQLADRLSLEMRSSNGKQFASQGAEGGLRVAIALPAYPS